MTKADSRHTTNPSKRRAGALVAADNPPHLHGDAAVLTGQQSAPLQPLDIEFDWSNEEWSKTFLPLLRLAVVAVQKDERSFEVVLQEWMASGVIDEALERWLETAEHLDGLVAVLNCVLARSAKVLRKIGVEPGVMDLGGRRAMKRVSPTVSTTAPERHAGSLDALARLREETVRQVTKLTGKGYRQTADCDTAAAGQSSGLLRSRRQVMVLMSSAAVLAIETKQAIATAADVTIAPAAPGDSVQLQALIDRYVEKKAAYRDLERRKDELKKVKLQMMPDPPQALCRRKADVRLFAETQGLRSTKIKIGEPYSFAELAVLQKYPMMRTRGIPIKRDEKGRWVDFAVGEEPSGKKYRDYDFRWIRERWPLAQKRADAIVAALKEYYDDREALQQRLGLPELEDADDKAFEEMCQVRDEIEEFEMRSMDDVTLKARFAVDHFDTNEVTESAADYFAWEMLRQLAERPGKGASA